MKFHHKLMMVYFVTIVIPIVGLSYYYMNKAEALIISHTGDSYQRLLQQRNNTIMDNLRFYQSFTDNLLLAPVVQDVLARPVLIQEKGLYQINKEIVETIRYLRAYRESDIESIRLYHLDDRTPYSDGQFVFPMSKLARSPSSMPNAPHWYLDETGNKFTYSLIRPVYSYRDFKKIGYMVLGVAIPSIVTIEDDSASGSGKDRMAIVDEGGKIVFHSDPGQIGKPISQEMKFNTDQIASQSPVELPNEAAGSSLIWHRTMENIGWTSFIMVPSRTIKQEVGQLRMSLLLAGMTASFVFLCITFIMTRRMTVGLRGLYAKVVRVGKGVLDSGTMHNQGKDEIAVLDRSFDEMTDNLRKLIHENYEVKLTKRELELKFLQAQINPHFLYNTLDSIKNEIDLGESETAVQMVIALADLFRISVSKGNELIAFRDEFEHARSYLDIMQVRFGGKFDVQWEIDPEVEQLYTLKVILQPILENAIQHGFRSSGQRGLILIRGLIRNGQVAISVEDNGAGMTVNALEVWGWPGMDHNRDEGAHGVGISNVSQRIQIHFGEEYGLDIHSVLGQGTTVCYRLPILWGDRLVPTADC